MKLKEMIELVQQHHSHMNETEIVRLLNRAADDFCEKSEILKSTYLLNDDDGASTPGRRYYKLDSITGSPDPSILKITEVWLNDTLIPRLIGKPPIDDDTSEIA
jgi:hypothetical protein